MGIIVRRKFKVFVILGFLAAAACVLPLISLARQNTSAPADSSAPNGSVGIGDVMRAIQRFLNGEVEISYVMSVINSFLGRGLQFRIAFIKNSYQVGDPMFCFMSLDNKSDNPVIVKSRMAVNRESEPHDVFFRVYDPDGRRLSFLPDVVLPLPLSSEDFVTLAQGELAVEVCQIEGLFEMDRPGKYKIQAVYVNGFSLEGINSWIGELESNIVEIELR
jgi:hypothetical protein